MKNYVFEFIGREMGALGVCMHQVVKVQAETLPEAHRKLYDTHEHISVLMVNSKTLGDAMREDSESGGVHGKGTGGLV